MPGSSKETDLVITHYTISPAVRAYGAGTAGEEVNNQ